MKKVFLTAFVAAAFAFGMAACNSNNAPEEPCDTTPVETTECCHQHECTCVDTTCAMNNCEGCADTTCCKKQCCQKEGACCQKEGAKEGECCKKAE